MIVAHNMLAMNAQRQFCAAGLSAKKSTEKLSSGFRINRAADDAAELQISEKTRRQSKGLNRGVNNAEYGISLCQMADSVLTQVNDILHRMTKLTVQSANGETSVSDRQAIQKEINHLVAEINRIGEDTKFNGKPVFQDDGSESATSGINASDFPGAIAAKSRNDGGFWIQSGCDAMDEMPLKIGQMDAEILGIDNLDVMSEKQAANSVTRVSDALAILSAQRSEIGAQQNRLEHTFANERNAVENVAAAESRIRDTGMAEEMVNYSKHNILEQAGLSMMTQANQNGQHVLALLQ